MPMIISVISLRVRFSAHYTEIVLKPLDQQLSETLINNILNITGFNRTISNKIIQQAEGNPFFIEEVLRSFIDEGALVVKDGSFAVTEKINSVVVPQTISDVVMARIDRLEQSTRNLLKVASVIGRSFFYRILREVAKSIDDLESKLNYLLDIQLICDRERMEELEYLFKHVLVQVTAYESLLLRKRKELHISVANAIEMIFKERLYDFFGMLAYHFSKGGDLEKAEVFMIKAGEQALQSSASVEALYFYREALKIYVSKYGENTDPYKIAMMNKNIAFALYNRGQYAEAIDYFKKALDYYGIVTPKRKIPKICKFVFCFLGFLIRLYFPFLKRKKIMDQEGSDTLALSVKKVMALSQIDSKSFFMQSFSGLDILMKYDLACVENGFGMFSSISILFSYSGTSFRLSKKILDFGWDKYDKNDVKARLYYEWSEIMHFYYEGSWALIKEYDDDLINQNLSKGAIFESTNFIAFHTLVNVDRGLFHRSQKFIDKISEIELEYKNDIAGAFRYEMKTKLLMKYRKFNEAFNELDEAIETVKKIDVKQYLQVFYVYKARIHTMLKNPDEALNSLNLAREYLSEIESVPMYMVQYFMSQFILKLYLIENSMAGTNNSELTSVKKEALKIGKKMIKHAHKVAADRTEAFRLMGTYYWLTGYKIKSQRWWMKSIEEGKQIGARLELSRTYMEIGKRLLESKSKYRELNGIKPDAYLKKARTMFEEMGLQWDLNELDRINIYS